MKLLSVRRWALILGLTVSIAPMALAQDAAKDSLRQDIESAKQKVYPAIVNIAVVVKFYQGGRAQRAPAGGSGVIVTKDGYVMTNYHVAGRTTKITCTLPSGESLPAKVALHDSLTDLSILKLDISRRSPTAEPLPFATLGNSDSMHAGDYVLAMGNPLTLSSSITLGIVSNSQRVFTDFTGTDMESMALDEGESTGLLTRWIQHDALIQPGNSGGPLVNLKGEVIGINELGGNGIGFAIPSLLAETVLKQALSGKPFQRGWLGFSALPTKKLNRTDGVLIAATLPGSPAEKGGLKAGDILLTLDGQPVNARFFEEIPLLYQKVAAVKPGQSVKATYLRNGASGATDLTAVQMEESTGLEDEYRELGVTLEEITGPMALERSYPDRNGVLVTGVRAGFPMEAAQPKLEEGDVILRIGSESTNNISDFRKAISSTKQQETLVVFRRNRDLMLTVVKTKPDVPEEDGGELPKAWVGTKTQVVTQELAKALGNPALKGFRVTRVYPWSQAAKAGIKAGDILSSLEKLPFAASRLQDSKEFEQAVENLAVGQKAAITGFREGKPIDFSVLLEATPAQISQAKKATQKEFEFSIRDLVPIDIEDKDLPPGQKGVLVTEVTQGGWASIAGLHADDVLLSIDGKLTTDVPTFEKVMKELKQAKLASALFFVRRFNKTHFVFAEPEWDKNEIVR